MISRNIKSINEFDRIDEGILSSLLGGVKNFFTSKKGKVENILKNKFDEYNKSHEFIIRESKNSMLCLKINSVEIVKA